MIKRKKKNKKIHKKTRKKWKQIHNLIYTENENQTCISDFYFDSFTSLQNTSTLFVTTITIFFSSQKQQRHQTTLSTRTTSKLTTHAVNQIPNYNLLMDLKHSAHIYLLSLKSCKLRTFFQGLLCSRWRTPEAANFELIPGSVDPCW